MRKSSVVYGDTQARTSAQNTYDDIVSKNQQQLYGQRSTRALSAKSGAKINPASLRNITKKVKSKLPKEKQVPPKVIIVLYLLFAGGSALFE